MHAWFRIAFSILSCLPLACTLGHVPDQLVPRWPREEPPNYYSLLERNLVVTPADCGRALVLPPFAGEEVVAVWSRAARYCVTHTKASRNIWNTMMHPKDPRSREQLKIARIDASIPASTALAIRRALTEMLRRTSSSGYDTERVPIHPTEYQFFLRDGAQMRIGTVADALAGKRTSELIGLAKLLIEYCGSGDLKRRHIAVEIERKANRLVSRLSDVRRNRPNHPMERTADRFASTF